MWLVSATSWLHQLSTFELEDLRILWTRGFEGENTKLRCVTIVAYLVSECKSFSWKWWCADPDWWDNTDDNFDWERWCTIKIGILWKEKFKTDWERESMRGIIGMYPGHWQSECGLLTFPHPTLPLGCFLFIVFPDRGKKEVDKPTAKPLLCQWQGTSISQFRPG